MSATQHSRATLIGFSAILMWGTLPLLTKLAGNIPPFQLTGTAFTVAFLITVAKWRIAGESIATHLIMPWKVWALGIFGLFGFHFFYFLAFQKAPAVEALLIVDLWPLLIVLFAALINKLPLHWWHIAGALLGFSGVILITTRDGISGFAPEYLPGYLAAIACALIWSLYSVFSRKVADIMPREAVGAFCGATALLSFFSHLAFEQTVELSSFQMLMLALMGIGPVGLAFFTWDYGVKYGNIRLLGTLSYCVLLIGVILLIAFGFGTYSHAVLIAAGLIIGGALLSSLDSLRTKRLEPQP